MSNSNVVDILNLIEETKKDSRYDVYIPSKGETYQLLPLTANDQKNLVKALVNSPIYSNETNLRFGEMLSSILPPTLTIEELTTFDKIFISIAVRAENIKDEYSVKMKTKGEKPTEFEKTISLSKHMEKVGKINHPEPKTLKVDEYKVTLSIPSIAADLEFESYLAQQSANIKNGDEAGLRDMISQFYITNILRHIESLTIKGTEIPYRSLPFPEKIQIGQKLISKLTREIVKSIDEDFGKSAMEVLKYTFTHNGESYENVISIDNTFYMV